MQQAKASSCEEHPRAALPEVPAGPLVISAGWGRTGTSSLKVQFSPLSQSQSRVQQLWVTALQSGYGPAHAHQLAFFHDSAASVLEHRDIMSQ